MTNNTGKRGDNSPVDTGYPHDAPPWAIQALKMLHNLEVTLGHLRPAQAFSETSLNTLAARSKVGGPLAGALSSSEDLQESPGQQNTPASNISPTIDSDEGTDCSLVPDANLTPEQVFDQIVRKLHQAGFQPKTIVALVNRHVGTRETLAYCDLAEVEESLR